MKPYSDQRFDDAIARARKYLGTGEAREQADRLSAAADERQSVDAQSGHLERLVLKSNGCITFLDVDTVEWIEAAGVYVYLHAAGRKHLYRSSVTQLLQRLDPRRFVRIHRSSAVNTAQIRQLHARSHGDYTLILKDGTELMLSRAYRAQVEAWLRQPI